MADICTLTALALTMTSQACFSPHSCSTPNADNRVFCTPSMQIACPATLPHYECKAADGSTYQLPWTAGPTSVQVPN